MEKILFTSFFWFFPTPSEEEVVAHLGKSILPWKSYWLNLIKLLSICKMIEGNICCGRVWEFGGMAHCFYIKAGEILRCCLMNVSWGVYVICKCHWLFTCFQLSIMGYMMSTFIQVSSKVRSLNNFVSKNWKVWVGDWRGWDWLIQYIIIYHYEDSLSSEFFFYIYLTKIKLSAYTYKHYWQLLLTLFLYRQ